MRSIGVVSQQRDITPRVSDLELSPQRYPTSYGVLFTHQHITTRIYNSQQVLCDLEHTPHRYLLCGAVRRPP